MNSIAILVQPSAHRVDCQAIVRTKEIGVSVFGISVVMAEAWLRFPIRPVLDAYLQATVSRTLSVVVLFFRNRTQRQRVSYRQSVASRGDSLSS